MLQSAAHRESVVTGQFFWRTTASESTLRGREVETSIRRQTVKPSIRILLRQEKGKMKAKRHLWRQTLTAEQLERRELLAGDCYCQLAEAPMGPPDASGNDGEPAQVQTQLQSRLQTQSKTQLQTRLGERNDEPLQQRNCDTQDCPSGDQDQTRTRQRDRQGEDPTRQQTRTRRSATADPDPAQPQTQQQYRLAQSDDAPPQTRTQKRVQTKDPSGAEDCDPVQTRDRTGQNTGQPVLMSVTAETAALTDEVFAATLETSEELDELEIQVAPNMLVLSSNGGKFTVHTNVPISWFAGLDLEHLKTAPVQIVLAVGELETTYDYVPDGPISVFADDCGNMVVQHEDASVVKGDVVSDLLPPRGASEKFTGLTVTLILDPSVHDYGLTEVAESEILVKA
jgi:hypothetical protein